METEKFIKIFRTTSPQFSAKYQLKPSTGTTKHKEPH